MFFCCVCVFFYYSWYLSTSAGGALLKFKVSVTNPPSFFMVRTIPLALFAKFFSNESINTAVQHLLRQTNDFHLIRQTFLWTMEDFFCHLIYMILTNGFRYYSICLFKSVAQKAQGLHGCAAQILLQLFLLCACAVFKTPADYY